jgi:tRNA/tmRNA/rRNA uracil-C5-methylase (TrmA/RlmC/RlmD family)
MHEGFGADLTSGGFPLDNDVDSASQVIATPSKAKRKRRKVSKQEPVADAQAPVGNDGDDVEVPVEELEPKVRTVTLTKYYEQRYSLFSRYDHGILLDDESWYSVTPEALAIHHARRCCRDNSAYPERVLVDACCGVGGNTIAFSSHCNRVIAIDIDPLKVIVVGLLCGILIVCF